MWAPQLERFRSAWPCLAPDLPGYGRRGYEPSPDSFEGFASDILGRLDEENAGRFVAIGLSMGGQIGMELFHQAPERMAGLVLAATFESVDPADVMAHRYRTAERLEQEGMEAYARELLPLMLSPATRRDRPELAQRVLRMMASASPVGAAGALRLRAGRRDYAPALEKIEFETLVVVGSHDSFTPLERTHSMLSHLSWGTLAMIDQAGHMPNLESPAQFNRYLANYLKRIVVPPERLRRPQEKVSSRQPRRGA